MSVIKAQINNLLILCWFNIHMTRGERQFPHKGYVLLRA